MGRKGDGSPLGDEGTPPFAWGSPPAARRPIPAPAARRAGSSPHRGGLCLRSAGPLPAAGRRGASARAGGAAGSERGGEGRRGAGAPRRPSRGRSRPRVPPHYHEKGGPDTGREGEGARLGRGARSLRLFSTVPLLCAESSPRARPYEKLGTSTFIPPPALPPSRG